MVVLTDKSAVMGIFLLSLRANLSTNLIEFYKKQTDLCYLDTASKILLSKTPHSGYC